MMVGVPPTILTGATTLRHTTDQARDRCTSYRSVPMEENNEVIRRKYGESRGASEYNVHLNGRQRRKLIAHAPEVH